MKVHICECKPVSSSTRRWKERDTILLRSLLAGHKTLPHQTPQLWPCMVFREDQSQLVFLGGSVTEPAGLFWQCFRISFIFFSLRHSWKKINKFSIFYLKCKLIPKTYKVYIIVGCSVMLLYTYVNQWYMNQGKHLILLWAILTNASWVTFFFSLWVSQCQPRLGFLAFFMVHLPVHVCDGLTVPWS